MAISVISWPQTQLMLVADVHQNTAARRITIIYGQVDENGDPVPGGRTRTQTITGANYDTLIATLQGGFLTTAVGMAVADGTFDNTVSVVTLGPSPSVSPSTSPSPSASGSSSASASVSRSPSASQSPSASTSPSHSQSPSASASPSS